MTTKPRRFQWMTPGCIFFRLYATKTIYFNVFIHKTRKLMFKVNPGMKRNYLACCRGKKGIYQE